MLRGPLIHFDSVLARYAHDNARWIRETVAENSIEFVASACGTVEKR